MAGGASSSSPFTPSYFTYDAFLSFRGEDTRFGFTGHLYSALDHRGIFTFIDDQEIGKGNEIRPSLVKAIQESRIAIVVLSKNYASSSFCLDELVKIMECFKGKKSSLVIPVFYDVDPSHVRKQIGTFGEALAEHENNFKANSNTQNFNDNMERLKKWREALKQVADLSGYQFKQGYVHEHKFIAKIVHQVSRGIKRVALHFVFHPVGLDHRVENLISLLDVGSSDGIRTGGLYGIGGSGIGKQALIKAVYNLIDDHLEDLSFEGLCFFGNIGENSDRHDLKHPQKIMWSLGSPGEAVIGLRRIIDLRRLRFSRHKMHKVLSKNEWYHTEFRFSTESRIAEIGKHVVRHKSSSEDICFPNPHRWSSLETLDRRQLSLLLLRHSLPMNSWDVPPAENYWLKDYLANSTAPIGISSTTTNVQATQPVKITDLAPDSQEKNSSDNSSANTSTRKQSLSASQKTSQSKENPEQEIPSEVIQEQRKEETSVQSPLEDADVFAIDDDDDDDDAEDGLTKRSRRADQQDTILISDSTIAENKPTTSLINSEEDVVCDNNIQIKEQENLESDSDDDDVDLSFMADITKGLSYGLSKPNPSSTSVSDLRSINPNLEHQISTETQATETNPEISEIPLKQLYELLHILNEPVDSLAENDDKKQRLINLIFDLNEKSLPPAVKPVIQHLENFIRGVFDTTHEVKRIEKDKEIFAASLCSLEKDLKKAQKSKNKIEAGLCKGKSGQLELEAQINDLMSKKKLIDSGIAKGEAELAKTNKKLASLTQDKEEKTKALSQASVQLERANMSKMKLLEDQNKLKLSIRSFLG